MTDRAHPWTLLNRRRFTGMAVGAVAAVGLALNASRAHGSAPPKAWRVFLDRLLDGQEAVEDKVTLDLPEVAENGNLVPFTVAVDHPMGGTDFVEVVHVIATDNDTAPVASFYFNALSGEARASSRMRLLRTQEIVALAQTNRGKAFIGRRRIEVVVGCCGE